MRTHEFVQSNECEVVRIHHRVVLPGTIGRIETVVRFELTPEELARVRARLGETPVYEIEPRSDDDRCVL